MTATQEISAILVIVVGHAERLYLYVSELSNFSFGFWVWCLV